MRSGKVILGVITLGLVLALAGCPTTDKSMKSDSGSMSSGGSMQPKDDMKPADGGM